jgi:hypothetical protein
MENEEMWARIKDSITNPRGGKQKEDYRESRKMILKPVQALIYPIH